jgi:hypothetical protein
VKNADISGKKSERKKSAANTRPKWSLLAPTVKQRMAAGKALREMDTFGGSSGPH